MDEATRLLLDARAGDRMALAAFIRVTQDDVWRYCAHLVDPASADDLVQDTFVRAMRGARTYRGDAPARRWLLSIARRACADEIRRRQRRRRREVVAASDEVAGRLDAWHDAPTPEASFAASEELTALLGTLPPDRREAFVLTQVVGLSYAEAAQVMDVAVGTIRSRVSRAREALVAALDPDAAGTRPER